MQTSKMIKLVCHIAHMAHAPYYNQQEAQKDSNALQYYLGEALSEETLKQIDRLKMSIKNFAEHGDQIHKLDLMIVSTATLISLTLRYHEMLYEGPK